MIFWFLASVAALFFFNALKNYIFYFHKKKDNPSETAAAEEQKEEPKEKYGELFRSFFRFARQNRSLLPGLAFPRHSPNWVISSQWTSQFAWLLKGLVSFLIPFAVSALLFTGLQLWVDLTPLPKSFDTILQIEQTRDYLVDLKSKLSIAGLPNAVSFYGLMLLFLIIPALPALRKIRILKLPLALLQTLQAVYMFLVLTTSFTFFAETVAEGSCTEKIETMQAKIDGIKDRAYTQFRKIPEIVLKEAALEVANSKPVDSLVTQLDNIREQVRKQKREIDVLKIKQYQINLGRREYLAKFPDEDEDEYPLVGIPPVSQTLEDWFTRFSNDLDLEKEAGQLAILIAKWTGSQGPEQPSDVPDISDTPSPPRNDPPSPDNPQGNMPGPEPPKPVAAPDLAWEEMFNFGELSEEKVDALEKELGEQIADLDRQWEALPRDRKIVAEAASTVLKTGQRYVVDELVSSVIEEALGELPLVGPLARGLFNQYVPKNLTKQVQDLATNAWDRLVRGKKPTPDGGPAPSELADYINSIPMDEPMENLQTIADQIDEESEKVIRQGKEIIATEEKREQKRKEAERKALALQQQKREKENALRDEQLKRENILLERMIQEKLNDIEIKTVTADQLSDQDRRGLINFMEYNGFPVSRYGNFNDAIRDYQRMQYLDELTSVTGSALYINEKLKSNLEKVGRARTSLDLAEVLMSSLSSAALRSGICPKCGLPLTTPFCLSRF